MTSLCVGNPIIKTTNMNNLTAQQLRNFLNEIEADGNDLSTIEINFREHDDSDVTPIGYVFEDLHDESNSALTSIVLQRVVTYNAVTNMNGFTTDIHEFVRELNALIGRDCFGAVVVGSHPHNAYHFSWLVTGTDITQDEIEMLNLSEDFVIN